jgi:hypothetical protein
MAKPRIKGTTVKARLDFARARGGDALVEKLKSELGPVGELSRMQLLTVRDFSVAEVEALALVISRELGGDTMLFAEMGAHSADMNRTMQKMVHRTNTDPHQLLAGIVREFPLFVIGDIGTIRYEPLAEQDAGRITWEGQEESGLSHCLSSIGYAVRVLHNWGVKGAAGANLECMAMGHTRCVWEFRWEEATGKLRNTTQIRSDALAERIRRISG